MSRSHGGGDAATSYRDGATYVMAEGSTRLFGSSVISGLTSLVAGVGDAAGGIDGTALDYDVSKIKSGRFTLIKDLDNKYL